MDALLRRLAHRRSAVLLALVAALTLGLASSAVADAPIPPAKGYVNDLAGVLSQATVGALEVKLRAHDKDLGNEVAVVTVKTLDGEDVASYANRMFREWGIGKRNKDNGVLILAAMTEHKLRIEVGYGLEGTLPDIVAKQIIDTKITPAFKANNFDKGITDGVDAVLERLVAGGPVSTRPPADPLALPSGPSSSPDPRVVAAVVATLAIIGTVVGISLLASSVLSDDSVPPYVPSSTIPGDPRSIRARRRSRRSEDDDHDDGLLAGIIAGGAAASSSSGSDSGSSSSGSDSGGFDGGSSGGGGASGGW